MPWLYSACHRLPLHAFVALRPRRRNSEARSRHSFHCCSKNSTACSTAPSGVVGSVTGGSVAGGSVAGGTVAGGSVAGGLVAGGSVAGGSVAGGSVATVSVEVGAVVSAGLASSEPEQPAARTAAAARAATERCSFGVMTHPLRGGWHEGLTIAGPRKGFCRPKYADHWSTDSSMCPWGTLHNVQELAVGRKGASTAGRSGVGGGFAGTSEQGPRGANSLQNFLVASVEWLLPKRRQHPNNRWSLCSVRDPCLLDEADLLEQGAILLPRHAAHRELLGHLSRVSCDRAVRRNAPEESDPDGERPCSNGRRVLLGCVDHLPGAIEVGSIRQRERFTARCCGGSGLWHTSATVATRPSVAEQAVRLASGRVPWCGCSGVAHGSAGGLRGRSSILRSRCLHFNG